MTPDQILSELGSQLKPKDIDKIYARYHDRTTIADTDFTFSDTGYTNEMQVRVLHTVWKAPMKVQFLTYTGEDGTPQEKIVDENYIFSSSQGDISIETYWVPETHETWKILDDIYVYCRPLPGQYKDLDNLWEAKLPYYGASIDNMNSPITAPMDRVKGYQYYFNIIIYRTEMLMASDKGKKLMMNINSIPKTSGIDIDKWLYFFEANSIGFLNPKEEGNKTASDVTTLVKEVDMSLVSTIDSYIKIAEYIEAKCGAAIGVTKTMEGAIGPTDAVTNTKQNLIQSNYIIRPYYELHNQVKRNILQGLIETAKVAYSGYKPKKIQYFLDDMSVAMLTVDPELLDNSTYGLFVTNSGRSEETRQAIIGLSQAALQNQQATLLDVANVMQSNSVQQAKELLEEAQDKAHEREAAIEQQRMQMEQQAAQRQEKFQRDAWEHEERMIVVKALEDRKTKLQVEAMDAMGYAEDKDVDKDEVPDVFEVYKYGTDASFKQRQLENEVRSQDLEEQKFSHQQKMDSKKLALEKEKLKKKATASKN
jgi:hypothetical protein